MSLIKIKQINNSAAQSGDVVSFDGNNNVWLPSHKAVEFSASDLTVNNELIIQHTIGRKFVQVSIFDENDEQIVPDSVRVDSSTQVTVNLTSFEEFITTWTVLLT